MGRNGICEKFYLNLHLLYSTYIALRGSNPSLMSQTPVSMVILPHVDITQRKKSSIHLTKPFFRGFQFFFHDVISVNKLH